MYRFILLICVVMATSSGATDLWSSKLGIPKRIGEDLARDLYMQRDSIGRWIRSLGDCSRSDPLPLSCTACNLAVTSALTLIRTDILGTAKDELIALCCTLNISTKEVCRGIVERLYPHIKYIVTKRLFISSSDVCSSFFQDGSCGKPNPALTNWEIYIDGNKPPVYTPYPPPQCNDTVYLLQITDIHLDLFYLNGSSSSCAEPVCCRYTDPETTASAGQFGANKCDTPRIALESLLRDAALRYNYSCVIISGDIVSHFLWLTNQESNIFDLEEFNKILRKWFGNKCVLFAIGNHEAHPIDMFPPKYVWGVQNGEFSLAWMYDRAATLFGENLPPDAVASLRSRGFYTVKIGNFRYVVINSNYCYVLNFWLYFDTVDPDGQLQWLANTLAEAEKAYEWVIILGHFPPGDSQCWSHWALQYNRIINRYENIIKGQFFGHTHKEEFKVSFSNPTYETGGAPYPTGCQLIGPSVVTYTGTNPGYRVLEVDNCIGDILDSKTYYYDIGTANKDGKPTWKELCSARGTYGFKRITPEECYEFVLRMIYNPELFQKWYKNRSRQSPFAAPCEASSRCPMDTLCDLVTTVPGDMSHCNRLKEIESQAAAY